MKYILRLLKKDAKNTSVIKSPVYVFFAEASSDVKTKAYKKALRSASEEQLQILSKYNAKLANTVH